MTGIHRDPLMRLGVHIGARRIWVIWEEPKRRERQKENQKTGQAKIT
jgi:hypothetical protein